MAKGLSDSYVTIKPLCPTRWLCRAPALSSVITQYKAVLDSLESMSDNGNSDTAVKARGLKARFQQGVIVLGLKVALLIFSILEQLNKSLQARNANVSGMIDSVRLIVAQLQSMRNNEKFSDVITDASDLIADLDLEPIVLPRQRKPPSRFNGPAHAYAAATAEEYHRAAYFAFIDATMMQLTTRFDANQNGIAAYTELETSLISGKINDAVKRYPEINIEEFNVQIAMFKMQFKCSSLNEAKCALQQMRPEVRIMFKQIEALVRLMLLCPVSSCEAEHSFSALRRLKT